MPLRPDERAEVYAIVKDVIAAAPQANITNIIQKEKPVDVAALVKSEVEEAITNIIQKEKPVDVAALVKSEVEEAIAKLMIPKDNSKPAAIETEKDSSKKGNIKK